MSRFITERKKKDCEHRKEVRRFIIIMCASVFTLAAAIPVIVYIVKRKRQS